MTPETLAEHKTKEKAKEQKVLDEVAKKKVTPVHAIAICLVRHDTANPASAPSDWL